MIHTVGKSNFKADFDCVGCYLRNGVDILLLKKPEIHKLYPGKWGVVAGKKKSCESIFVAIQREVKEETGYKIG